MLAIFFSSVISGVRSVKGMLTLNPQSPPFKGTPGFTRIIHGEKSEIKVTVASAALQASDDDWSIAVHNFATDEVEVIEWERQFTHLPPSARNVAAMYEAFADGEMGKYPDFEHAVLRHRQIDEVFKSSEEDKKRVYLS